MRWGREDKGRRRYRERENIGRGGKGERGGGEVGRRGGGDVERREGVRKGFLLRENEKNEKDQFCGGDVKLRED